MGSPSKSMKFDIHQLHDYIENLESNLHMNKKLVHKLILDKAKTSSIVPYRHVK